MIARLAAMLFLLVLLPSSPVGAAELRAGAAVIDVSPTQLPVLINGGMTSHKASEVKNRIHARAIVLDAGRERVGIVVVDSCMMPRPLLDEIKQLAARQTKLAADKILISAVHTHSTPSSMGCLGTSADEGYLPVLKDRLPKVLAAAEANLEPARVGWASVNAAEYTALRRWIRRPDRMADDPFGNPTVRANMHAAAKSWDDVVGPSGPEDPDLTMVAFQSADGRPIAMLANFSMHYFGDQAISPDYFGRFCDGFQAEAGSKQAGARPMVAIMSHGCSGDIWLRDYMQPPGKRHETWKIDQYTRELLGLALGAYRGIRYEKPDAMAMAERRVRLKYRVPDKQRLEWAQRIVDAMGQRDPKNIEEVYAREQVLLHEAKETDIVLQAIRVGPVALATTSTETYALTGLKLKRQSPLEQTMVIELANGGDGYVPPPEQHLLGGYNTWPARSAGLEVDAEPKMVEASLELLEKVAGKPRRAFQQAKGPAAKAIEGLKPAAWWRLDEFAGPRAVDASGHLCDGFFEPGVVYFLEGPRADRFCVGEENRAVQFTGGRMQARMPGVGDRYSVSLWFWNGMPADGREVTGWMFSRGYDRGLASAGDHLGLAGKGPDAAKLIFLHGDPREGAKPLVGRTALERWTWHQVTLVRDGRQVRVYLDGKPSSEIESQAPVACDAKLDRFFFGGRTDNDSNWEGRLDEIAVFDRALTTEEAKRLGGE